MDHVVSIIIPVYKVEKYICKCIDSVINQTYRNIEILLIDDGSTDNCGQICDEYSLTDHRIKVIHKINGGLSSARNTGLDICTGDYIMFVDSDDYIAKDAVEKSLNALMANKSDICVFNFVKTTEDGKEIYDCHTTSPIINEKITSNDYFKKLTERNYWYYVISCNKLYKRQIFEKIRFPVGKVHEDEFVIHEIICESETLICITDILYYYVQTEHSIMRIDYNITRMDCAEALLNRSQFFFDNDYIYELQYSLNCVIYILIQGYRKLNLENRFVKDRLLDLNKQFKILYYKIKNTGVNMKTKIKIILYLLGILPFFHRADIFHKL